MGVFVAWVDLNRRLAHICRNSGFKYFLSTPRPPNTTNSIFLKMPAKKHSQKVIPLRSNSSEESDSEQEHVQSPVGRKRRKRIDLPGDYYSDRYYEQMYKEEKKTSNEQKAEIKDLHLKIQFMQDSHRETQKQLLDSQTAILENLNAVYRNNVDAIWKIANQDGLVNNKLANTPSMQNLNITMDMDSVSAVSRNVVQQLHTTETTSPSTTAIGENEEDSDSDSDSSISSSSDEEEEKVSNIEHQEEEDGEEEEEEEEEDSLTSPIADSYLIPIDDDEIVDVAKLPVSSHNVSSEQFQDSKQYVEAYTKELIKEMVNNVCGIPNAAGKIRGLMTIQESAKKLYGELAKLYSKDTMEGSWFADESRTIGQAMKLEFRSEGEGAGKKISLYLKKTIVAGEHFNSVFALASMLFKATGFNVACFEGVNKHYSYRMLYNNYEENGKEAFEVMDDSGRVHRLGKTVLICTVYDDDRLGPVTPKDLQKNLPWFSDYLTPNKKLNAKSSGVQTKLNASMFKKNTNMDIETTTTTTTTTTAPRTESSSSSSDYSDSDTDSE